MSTKFTIYSSDNVHMYGDVFDSESISLNIKNPLSLNLTIINDDAFNIKNQFVDIKISRIHLEKICKEYINWIKNN